MTSWQDTCVRIHYTRFHERIILHRYCNLPAAGLYHLRNIAYPLCNNILVVPDYYGWIVLDGVSDSNRQVGAERKNF